MPHVDANALYRDPQQYNFKHITVDGLYTNGFEHSNLAGAWVRGGLPGPCRIFVRATGVLLSGGQGYGHLGVAAAELRVEEMTPIQPVPYRTVQENEVILHEQDCYRVLRLFRTVRSCLGRLTAGSERLERVEKQAAEPEAALWERDAQLLVIPYPNQSLEALEVEWVTDRRPVTPVTLETADQIEERVGNLVRLSVELVSGFYWPEVIRRGGRPIAIVPPELSARDERNSAKSEPPHPIVAEWDRRLQAGPIAARLEGYVDTPNKVFATALDPID